MPRRFNSSFTIFVYLNGHNLLEHYFAVSDTRTSANDSKMKSRAGGGPVSPCEPRLRP